MDSLRTVSLLGIVILSLSLMHIPTSFCQDPQYLACGREFRCGNIAFAYPFWIENEQSSACGYPGFQVTCQTNIPRILIGQVTYRVLKLGGTVTIARDDLWNNFCPTFLMNTTLDFNIFSYSDSNENLTLSYGCTSSAPAAETKPSNEFVCVVNDTTSSSFFTSTNVISSNTTNPLPLKCNSSIFVPIHQTAAKNLKDTAALRAALAAGFTLRYEANNTICKGCIQTGGRCGYNHASSSFVCYCYSGAQDFVCYNGAGSRWIFGAIGLAVGNAILASSVVVIIYYLAKRYSWLESIIYWKLDEEGNLLVQEFMRNHGFIAPKLYTYPEIRKMTNSFAEKLGQGGYGCVYKGKLPDGRHVAVKVLNENKGNGEEFINEVASISKTSHVNVVTLLGFCYNKKKRALIYEFMPNGSLDKFICKKESSLDTTKDHLEWKLLFKITVGIARGLEYLHQGCNTRIVHFDIKPQNILLDAEFCPKISDFGLARLYQRKESLMSALGARGTVGYIAPEVIFRNFGGVSHKSDVYSYGMMVLEIVGLRRKLDKDSQQTTESYFPDWIYEHIEVGKDLPLEGVSTEEEEDTAMKMILVALWCIQTNPAERPSISKVVEMLEGSLRFLQIPPMPSLVSHTTVNFNQESCTTSSILRQTWPDSISSYQ